VLGILSYDIYCSKEDGDLYALGRHLLVELKECNSSLLDNLEFLQETLHSAAVRCGATVVGDSFYHFSPQGVSGVVNIAESHISIHTWPECGYAAVDVFTCGERVKPEEAARYIKQAVEAGDCSVIELRRGLLQSSPVPSATK
jgi:S-adenosylmethionine decarboxylase